MWHTFFEIFRFFYGITHVFPLKSRLLQRVKHQHFKYYAKIYKGHSSHNSNDSGRLHRRMHKRQWW